MDLDTIRREVDEALGTSDADAMRDALGALAPKLADAAERSGCGPLWTLADTVDVECGALATDGDAQRVEVARRVRAALASL